MKLRLLADFLSNKGINNLYILEGGIGKWLEKKYQIFQK
jgi:rhodanese-related sulfurtransferase